MTQDFTVAPLSRLAWLLMLVVPGAIIIGLLLSGQQATPTPIWLPFLITLAMVVLILTLRRQRISIDGQELTIAATFYTRRVAIHALDLDKARIINLSEHTDFKPAIKTNGFNLPGGFLAGHCRLRNRVKAFCLLTDHERVLVLPESDGKLILLSPEKPQALLARLRELSHQQPASHKLARDTARR